MKWCDKGIYLLASQPVDKCQSQDGAESALQEIEKFLDTGAGNKIKELSKIYREYAHILNEDLKVPECVYVYLCVHLFILELLSCTAIDKAK